MICFGGKGGAFDVNLEIKKYRFSGRLFYLPLQVAPILECGFKVIPGGVC
jgi:hypothetical protein